MLAVGNDKGVINIFDLRKSSSQSAATVMAHIHTTSRLSKKVKGIRPDPFNNFLFASFSDIGGEPVKVQMCQCSEINVTVKRADMGHAKNRQVQTTSCVHSLSSCYSGCQYVAGL
jgi:hypothetical protein